MIRLVNETDIETVNAIDIAADKHLFGQAYPARPLSQALIEGCITAKTFWVFEQGGEIRGFLCAKRLVDNILHIEQVSTHPDSMRRGIATALFQHCITAARAMGMTQLSLTTNAEAIWGVNLYQKLGFQEQTQANLIPDLQAILHKETVEHGMPNRVCMVLQL